MSIVTHNGADFDFGEDYSGAGGRCQCTNCGGTLRYPFLEWRMHRRPNLFLCRKCCREIKRGLTADLDRIARPTIQELFNVGEKED